MIKTLIAPDGTEFEIELTGDNDQDSQLIQNKIKEWETNKKGQVEQPATTPQTTQTVSQQTQGLELELTPEITETPRRQVFEPDTIIGRTEAVAQDATKNIIQDDKTGEYSPFWAGFGRGMPFLGNILVEGGMSPEEVNQLRMTEDDNPVWNTVGRMVGEVVGIVIPGGAIAKIFKFGNKVPGVNKLTKPLTDTFNKYFNPLAGGTTAQRAGRGALGIGLYEGGEQTLRGMLDNKTLDYYTDKDGNLDMDRLVMDAGIASAIGATFGGVTPPISTLVRKFFQRPGSGQTVGTPSNIDRRTMSSPTRDESKRAAGYVWRTNDVLREQGKDIKEQWFKDAKPMDVTFGKDSNELMATVDNIIANGKPSSKALLTRELIRRTGELENSADYKRYVEYLKKEPIELRDFKKLRNQVNRNVEDVRLYSQVLDAIQKRDTDKLHQLGQRSPDAKDKPIDTSFIKRGLKTIGRDKTPKENFQKVASNEAIELVNSIARSTARRSSDWKNYENEVKRKLDGILLDLNNRSSVVLGKQVFDPDTLEKPTDKKAIAKITRWLRGSAGRPRPLTSQEIANKFNVEELVGKLDEADNMFTKLGRMHSRLDALRGGTGVAKNMPDAYVLDMATDSLIGSTAGISTLGRGLQVGGFITQYSPGEKEFISALFKNDPKLIRNIIDDTPGPRFTDIAPALSTTTNYERMQHQNTRGLAPIE